MKSRKLPDASTRRDQTELLTVTVPPRTGASNGPRSDEIRVDDRAESLGVAQAHFLAGGRQVELAGAVADEADAAAESHQAAAEARGQVVQPQAVGVEGHAAVDRLERVRQREVANASAGDRRLAGEDRVLERPGDLRREVGLARAAQVAHDALENAEVGLSRRSDRDLAGAEVDRAADVEARAIADETQLVDAHDFLLVRHAQRAVVADHVVEQPQRQRVGARVDAHLLRVAQLSGDPQRAAGDSGRERREVGPEDADVRVDRRVGEPEREVAVRFVGHRHAAGAGHDQPGRRGVQLHAQRVVANRQPRRHLADAFVFDEQVRDAEPHRGTAATRTGRCPTR